MNELYSPIGSLKGIGKARAEKYHKLGIETPLDLLYHIPRNYLDYSCFVPIESAKLNQYNMLKLMIVRKAMPKRVRDKMMLYKIIATDGCTDITITIFNNVYAFNDFIENDTYYMYGKVTDGYNGYEIISPQFIKSDENVLIQPIYHLTTGLTVVMVRQNMKQAVQIMKSQPIETLSDNIKEKNNLCDLTYALQNIHFPESNDASRIARERLAFDEMMFLQLGMALMRNKSKTHTNNIMDSDVDISDFYQNLPFELTDAQKNAVDEIISDLGKDVPMNRLLQGDVGSGKTVVAGAVCCFTAKNGFQSALMAPTEILAHQHYLTLKAFLEPLGMKVCLLVGSISAKNKNIIKKDIKLGLYDVVVGTHAIIQKDTEFKALGLVITDEQHRFGVAQRLALAEKGDYPHKLVMSATPIPRTLALIIYGDLDISVINQLPKGRKPISTYAVTGKVRFRAFGFVREALDANRQAYVVCPMIEESESDLIAVKSYAQQASETFLLGYQIGLLHGKMNAKDKEDIMAEFKAGNIQVLICTTVVEVGVDVPNATVIVIENADRFGLSQLHQLRGRVGRGVHESSCILITDNLSEECRNRMKVMCNTTNGFEISEEDLKMRGPGDFFGSRQHGLPPLKIADLACDAVLMKKAQDTVKFILDDDPLLDKPENNALKLETIKLFDKEIIG